MALAFLKFQGKNNGNYTFQADIGTAKYFKYVTASKQKKIKVGKNEFITVLDENKKVSKLLQLNEAMQKINKGSFPLTIPETEIDADAKYVQLYSFSNRRSKAPTISNIIRLYPMVGRTHNLTFSNSIETTIKNESIMQETLVRNKAFNYQEPKLSKVMFWNAIINALPTIVEHAAPVIGSLVGGSNTNQPATNTQNNTAESNKTSEVISKVVEVLEAISNNANPTPANATLAPATTTETSQTSQPATNGAVQQPAQSIASSRLSVTYSLEPETVIGLTPILEKLFSPEAILAIGDDPQKLFLAIKDAVQKTEGTSTSNVNNIAEKAQNGIEKSKGQQFSEAKVAPALLAALPALMPVIEKALDPKLIEAVGNQPVKLFKAIGDAVLKMDEQEIKHLEAINPGVDTADDIAKMLIGMSINSSMYKEDIIEFKLLKSLNLNFKNTKTVNFKNKQRVLYAKNQRIAIPFEITTSSGRLSKILKKSVIQILIKDAETMALVFRKNIKLVNVDISIDVNEAYLTVEEIKGIPCNKELKLEVSHVWKSNENENIGVFKSHYIHFIESYIFDRIGEEIGEPIPLNDINVHRNYWHKIWEGGFSQSNRWHVEFDLKYYYLLNTKAQDLSRLETKKRITEDNVEPGQEHPGRRKVKAKLKSGTELGMHAINELLSLLNQPVLESSILEVLSKSDIEKVFQQVSRMRLEMKGREGDTSTLWSYPEMSLYKLHLSQIGDVDAYGQVVSLTPIEKVIPKPNFIHFIGTTSER
ncbi:hypothetical protein [Lacinutrix sp. Hel_I_90]|uniref:hypothetical protein n=1 Tax=Lacinutrix sp. Hel_I_90 TaxID=1249999 RepID=UPI0005C9C15C|nr:hypothetical protein [Lacinutrix sp. Hel_I_90]